jgi:hypothetical protein
VCKGTKLVRNFSPEIALLPTFLLTFWHFNQLHFVEKKQERQSDDIANKKWPFHVKIEVQSGR